MTGLQIVFLVVAALTLVSAGMVVSARRMMHAALWLVLTLLGVAVLFATLESSFFTVVQVVIYIGAIAILIIFSVMLTRRDLQEEGPRLNRFAWLSAAASAAVFAGMVGALSAWQRFNAARPEFAGEDIAELGLALVSPDGYVLPFEVVSVLLIGALIGAIYVASEQRKG
jgi:NADH-quinone oxidoreductase subunit J